MTVKTTIKTENIYSLTNVILFSAYPVLAFYSNNIELLNITQVYVPLMISIIFGVLVYLTWSMVFKDFNKASYTTIILLGFFWFYDMLFQGMGTLISLKHYHLIPIIIFSYAHLIFLTYPKKKVQKKNHRYNIILFYPLLFIVIYNIFSITISEFNRIKYKEINRGYSGTYSDIDRDNSLPNIFLIILDEYASLKTIKSEWAYDNSEFRNFLEHRGFYVAERSKHRYIQTMLNMSSLLNLEYITESVTKQEVLDFFYNKRKVRGSEAYAILSISDTYKLNIWQNNELMLYLKAQGFEINVIEGVSLSYPTLQFNIADNVLSYQNISNNSNLLKHSSNVIDNVFFVELMKTTVFSAFGSISTVMIDNVYYNGTRAVFNYLKNINEEPRHKFYYAHIMCPHTPFVFDRSGNYNTYLQDLNKAYLEQYIYATNETKMIIENLLKHDNTNSIIIIQNDHGPRPHQVNISDSTQTFSAFNAVFFPNHDYSNLHDSISPVNTLRVMLNQYFGQNYILLED